MVPSGFAQVPGQPFASYWFPNDLLNWDPSSDPDATFNRSNTPLAGRFMNPDLNVNPHAHSNEGRVMSLVGFHATSNNPSQGSLSANYYAVNYWQYMDVLVFFGGSSSEGLILAPNPTVIDAAHRNGVIVLGNIFFPTGNHIQWVRDLVRQSGASFPVADKLIQVAQYYGFDGWFINQESSGGNADDATHVRDFMKYIKNSSNLTVVWYDSMITTGSISYQNQLDNLNAPFFSDADGVVSDAMFLNYNWNSGLLSSSRTYAQNLGRSPYDLAAGANVQGSGPRAGGFCSDVHWDALFPDGEVHKVSLGFYRPEWTFKYASDMSDFYVRDNAFWVGASRDPRNTDTPLDDSLCNSPPPPLHKWHGIAHYVPAKSPIARLPFISNFNTGQGHLYAIDGQILMSRDWNNLSLQDVLPTWRWIVDSTGSQLYPDFDFGDAYNGGTSLKVTGTLDAPNHLKLFEASLPVSADTKLRIAYKIGAPDVPTHMKVGIAFEDDPTAFEFLDVSPSLTAGWDTKTFDLASFAGRTVAVISLFFDSCSAIPNYSIGIGQIAVFNDPVAIPGPPSGLTVLGKIEIDPARATLRLGWNHSPDPIYYYNVYRRNPDATLSYLGGTPNSAYFVPEVDRVGSETETTIEVEAVGPAFSHSTHATTTFTWDES